MFGSILRVKELKDDLSVNVKDLEKSNTLLGMSYLTLKKGFCFYYFKVKWIVYLTEEAAEQSAKKNLELKLLQDDLVKKQRFTRDF